MTTFRFNPTNPIPNEPFYYPQSEALSSASGPLIVGSGINIDYATGVISATGGGGGVASVTVVSPVTNTGTASNPVIGVQVANTLQQGVVQVGPNIQVASGTISVLSASTLQAGVVRLNDSTNSSSNLEALTANQGRNLQDQIDALAISSSLTLAGTFDSTASQLVSVTSVGAAAGFASGSNLPAPAPAINNYYVVVTTGGSYTPPGSSTAYSTNPGDWFVCDGVTWLYFPLGQSVPYATETNPGIIEIATLAEVQAGTDPTLAVTPATASSVFIPNAVLGAKGSLIGATAAGAAVDVALGAEGDILTVCNACSTGLTWAPLPPNDAIPCALLTAKGQLVGASASNTPVAISTGADGQYLTACAACGDGVYWSSSVDIPCSLLTGKGQIVTATAPDTPVALPVGTDGQLLAACSTCPDGLTWITSAAGGGIPTSIFTDAQELLISSAANTPSALPVGGNGCILTVSSGTIGWCPNTAIPCSLLTCKGQMVSASGCGTPVATPAPVYNNEILVSCSTCCSGWTTTTYVPFPSYLYTCRGQLWAGTGNSVFGVLNAGSNGSKLTACSANACGLCWIPGAPLQNNRGAFSVGQLTDIECLITSANGLIPGNYLVTVSGDYQSGNRLSGTMCLVTYCDSAGTVQCVSPGIAFSNGSGGDGSDAYTPYTLTWALPVGPGCSIRFSVTNTCPQPISFSAFATALPY